MAGIEVTAIQRGCVHDGAGIRTTVFLRGCLLRCPWCCNPETWIESAKYIFDASKCLHHKGYNSQYCNECILNGGYNDVLNCAFQAAKPISTIYNASELFHILEKDFPLMVSSGGGVTFSGGEPFLQASALTPLLDMLSDNGIDICFETSLVAPKNNILDLLPYSNELIVDLKLQPQMFLKNAEYVENIKEYLLLLPTTSRFVFRMVFVDAMIDFKETILENLQKLGINDIQLIMAHNLAKSKYKNLNINYFDFTPDSNLYNEFANYINANSINVTRLVI